MSAMKGLGVGRIVHYSYPDHTGNKVNGVYPLMCHAAIIVRPIDAERGVVNLQWFDDVGTHAARGVLMNRDDQPKEGTWHWPEQA